MYVTTLPPDGFLSVPSNEVFAVPPAVGLLDPFQVRGIVAGFWYQTKYDFLTLMARGAKGVADAWRTSIVTALEDKASRESPLEHKLVKFLMSDFVEDIKPCMRACGLAFQPVAQWDLDVPADLDLKL